MFRLSSSYRQRGYLLAAVLLLGSLSAGALFSLFDSPNPISNKDHEKEQTRLPFAERQLSSPLFLEYMQQLQSSQQETLKLYPHFSQAIKEAQSKKHAIADPKTVEELALLTLSPPSQKASEPNRKWHQQLLTRLRQLSNLKKEKSLPIQNADYRAEAEAWFHRLTYWVYAGPNLWPALMESAVQLAIFKPQTAPFQSGHAIASFYKQIFENLSQSQFSGRDKESDSKSESEDFHLAGDVPFVLYTTSKPSFVKIIRTPTVAIQSEKGHSRKFKVNPSFKAYLECCKKQNERHLYINLMRRQGKEAERSRVIEELESKERLKDAVAVATLDKDSEFYSQEGTFAKNNEAEAFKKLFLERLTQRAGLSTYYWPKSLQKEEWNQDLKQILASVHRDYFDNSATLNVQARQDFIELAYLKIIEALFVRLKPNNCTIACKHSIDRAPSQIALLYLYQQWDPTKHQMEAHSVNLAAALLFTPAILNHNRSIFSRRVERLNQALARLFPEKR